MSRRFVYLGIFAPPFVLSGSPKGSAEVADPEGIAHDDNPQHIEIEDLVRPN